MVILQRSSHNISRRNIDEDALKVMYRLNRHGFKAYLVGGAVRDMLLGRIPKDFDIATDAKPGQIKKLFSNSFLIGRRFRLAHIRFRDNKIIEVATFRREPNMGSEEDIHNTFGTPMEDAFRRDITVNALFYDISDFSVIDYTGGLSDLKNRIVRIIGEPDRRFKEDPVRLLRVLRHSSRLGFRISPDTARGIYENGSFLAGCSGSRMFEELCKDIKSGFFRAVFSQMDLFGILPFMFGRIGKMYSNGPEILISLLNYLAEVDSRCGTKRELQLYEVFSLFLWPWATRKLEYSQDISDKPKFLQDELVKAGLQVQIPKSLSSNMIQVLSILNNLQAAIKTNRFKYSEMKKTHYKDASRLFGIINNQFVEMDDPFDEYAKNSFSQERKRYPKRKYFRNKPTNSRHGV
jgi:poly(A) polymerase